MATLQCFSAASFFIILVGCTGATTNSSVFTPIKPKVLNFQEPTVSTSPQIVSNDDDPGGTPTEVFARAKTRMEAGNYKKARVLFDRVVEASLIEQTKSSSLMRAAMYNAALCSEQLDESMDARDRFRQLAIQAQGTADALDAQFRRARLDVEIEDFKDLSIAVSDLFVRTDLNDGDRGEVYALQAIGFVHENELDEAEKALTNAQRYVHSLDDVLLSPPHNVAAVAFARGELLSARSFAIKLNPVGVDFSEKLEQRCQKLLDAEQAYVEAIRTKQLKWAIRSGVRVASLYRALHEELLSIPAPVSANTTTRQALFRGAIRLRYRILLEKSIRTLDRTLNLEPQLAQKQRRWFERARVAKEEMQKSLLQEKEELSKLPYTEDQLQKALTELASK